MYSVIIAEDEMLIRIGLDATIPWTSLSMRLEASTSNGEKAWEAYKQYHPDIVITDIRMPVMDGLELAHKIREVDHRCRIVVITCIEDFNILREFVNLDISGYLLKATMVREEIFAILKKVKDSLDEENPGETKTDSVSSEEQYLELIEAYAIQRTLSFSEFDQRRKQFSYPYIPLVMAVYLDIGSLEPSMYQSICNSLRDRFRSLRKCMVVTQSNRMYVFFYESLQENLDALRKSFEEIASYMESLFGAKLRAAACQTGDSLESLPLQLNQCCSCMNNPFFYPDYYYVIQKDSLFDRNAVELIASLRGNPALINLAREGSGWTLPLLINKLQTAYGTDKDGFLQACRDLFALFYDSVKALDPEIIDRKIQETDWNALSVLKLLHKSLPECKPHPVYGKAILKTIDYIDHNLDTALSLSDISAMINLSQNYYTALFKSMVGINYIDYLVRMRVEKACELLKTTELTLQQISQECGFGDITYFSRCFKKKIGVPPRQWRINE